MRFYYCTIINIIHLKTYFLIYTFKLMRNKLAELNIRSFFDFVLVSQKTASEKPSAEMFHLARQTCGM